MKYVAYIEIDHSPASAVPALTEDTLREFLGHALVQRDPHSPCDVYVECPSLRWQYRPDSTTGIDDY